MKNFGSLLKANSKVGNGMCYSVPPETDFSWQMFIYSTDVYWLPTRCGYHTDTEITKVKMNTQLENG